MQTPVKVTRSASQVRGSSVWLDPRETFQVKELFLAAALRSANDATFLIAEFFGNGNVGNFIKRMNQFAREIGMNQTHYYNPHGLPGKNAAADNVSTAEDMARLAIYTLTKPELMKFFSTRIAGFRSSRSKAYQMLINHNGLLPKGRFGTEGVDGLKTGFTIRCFIFSVCITRNIDTDVNLANTIKDWGKGPLVYCIPLFADCKFRNRFHPASDIGVPNESAWSYKNSHNALSRSGAAAS